MQKIDEHEYPTLAHVYNTRKRADEHTFQPCLCWTASALPETTLAIAIANLQRLRLLLLCVQMPRPGIAGRRGRRRQGVRAWANLDGLEEG